MPLIKKTSPSKPLPEKGATVTGSKATAKAEEDPTTTQAAAVEAEPVAAAAPAAPAAPAVPAVAKATAVLVPPTPGLMNYLDQYKNRLRVTWNTLIRLQANNGNILNKDAQNASLGSEIQLRLMSYQDSYQLAPGGNDQSDETKALVRYSDDGITTTQGENCKEYIKWLREEMNFPKAKMDHRCVLVGELVATSKESKALGELVQIDLPKTSKDEFDKYLINCAFKLGKGLLQPEQAEVLTMECEVVSKNNNSWTVVKFKPTMDVE